MTLRVFIQFGIIVIGVAFEAMGKGYGRAQLFLLSNYQESIRGYVYYICEHLKFISLAVLLWLYPAKKEDFNTDRLFVILACLDFVDYLVTGNDVWFGFGVKPMLPISMNTMSILIFGLYAYHQWKRNGLTNG